MGKTKTKVEERVETTKEVNVEEKPEIPETVEATPEEAQEFIEEYVETPTSYKTLIEGEEVARIYHHALYTALIPAYIIDAEPTITMKDGEVTVSALDPSMIMAVAVTGSVSGYGDAQFSIMSDVLDRAVRFRAHEIVVRDDGKVTIEGEIRIGNENSKPITIATKYVSEPDQRAIQIAETAKKFVENAQHSFEIPAKEFVKVAKELSGNGISTAVYFVATAGKFAIYEEGTLGVLVAELTETVEDTGVIGKYNSDYIKTIGEIVQKIGADKVTLMFGEKDQPMVAVAEKGNIEIRILLAPMIDEYNEEDIVEIVRALA